MLLLLKLLFILTFFLLAFSYIHTKNINNKAFSDTDTFSFVVAGDWGSQPDTTVALKKIARLKPDFAIALGDLSYDDVRPETVWCQYVKSNLPPNFPCLLVG